MGKRYELLKESAGNFHVIPAGMIFELNVNEPNFNKHGKYVNSYGDWFDKDFVENNHKWFKEIKEFQWTESLVWDVIRAHEKSYTKNIQHTIDEFKVSKQSENFPSWMGPPSHFPVQEQSKRIEVLGHRWDKVKYCGEYCNELSIYIPYDFEYEKETNLNKIQLIKQAIEKILNQ